MWIQSYSRYVICLRLLKRKRKLHFPFLSENALLSSGKSKLPAFTLTLERPFRKGPSLTASLFQGHAANQQKGLSSPLLLPYSQERKRASLNSHGEDWRVFNTMMMMRQMAIQYSTWLEYILMAHLDHVTQSYDIRHKTIRSPLKNGLGPLKTKSPNSPLLILS